MIPAEVKVGFVLRYSYLWHWQQLEGREDGDKDRPCLVLALLETGTGGQRLVRVLPITHTAPNELAEAIEFPLAVKQRLGLDVARSWIVLTESNRFVWPGPDLRPTGTGALDGYYGPIPPALFARVRDGFVAMARRRRHTSITRTD